MHPATPDSSVQLAVAFGGFSHDLVARTPADECMKGAIDRINPIKVSGDDIDTRDLATSDGTAE
jgi:hypothetical protein